jgi:hypothetical protein
MLKKGPCSQPMQHTHFGNHELKSNICSQKEKENKEQEYKVSCLVQIHLFNWPANYLTVDLLFPSVLLGKCIKTGPDLYGPVISYTGHNSLHSHCPFNLHVRNLFHKYYSFRFETMKTNFSDLKNFKYISVMEYPRY